MDRRRLTIEEMIGEAYLAMFWCELPIRRMGEYREYMNRIRPFYIRRLVTRVCPPGGFYAQPTVS